MSFGVVDILEVVEIDEKNADLFAFALRHCQCMVQPIEKHAAIRQTCKGVVVGEVVDLFFRFFPVGDILAGGDNSQTISHGIFY